MRRNCSWRAKLRGMVADSFLEDRNVAPGLIRRADEPHAVCVAPTFSASRLSFPNRNRSNAITFGHSSAPLVTRSVQMIVHAAPLLQGNLHPVAMAGAQASAASTNRSIIETN